jgi:hypothetical protein
MTLAKAIQGAQPYAVSFVIYGVTFMYPYGSMLEIQLSFILFTTALVIVSNYKPRVLKWFDFAPIISLLLLLPVVLYLAFNEFGNVILLRIFFFRLSSKYLYETVSLYSQKSKAI